jgi:hypothetical protein
MTAIGLVMSCTSEELEVKSEERKWKSKSQRVYGKIQKKLEKIKPIFSNKYHSYAVLSRLSARFKFNFHSDEQRVVGVVSRNKEVEAIHFQLQAVLS